MLQVISFSQVLQDTKQVISFKTCYQGYRVDISKRYIKPHPTEVDKFVFIKKMPIKAHSKTVLIEFDKLYIAECQDNSNRYDEDLDPILVVRDLLLLDKINDLAESILPFLEMYK